MARFTAGHPRADCLYSVQRDQLRIQRSATSMGEHYLFSYLVKGRIGGQAKAEVVLVYRKQSSSLYEHLLPVTAVRHLGFAGHVLGNSTNENLSTKFYRLIIITRIYAIIQQV